MVNPTYKHLEDRFRIGPCSLGQWAQLFASVIGGLIFGVYLSPFSVQITISISILMAGVPFAVSYAAMDTEFSVSELARVAAGFYRTPRSYPPGAGDTGRSGYRVNPDPVTEDGQLSPGPEGPDTPTPTGEALWDY